MQRPAIWTAAALAAGIAVAQWLRPHPALALVAVVVCTVAAVCSHRRGALALLLAVACTGALRYAYVQTVGRGDATLWQGQKVALTGSVVSETELRPPSGVGYVVAVERIDNHPASGRVHVTQRGGQPPRFGDRVELSGRLQEPPGPRVPGGYDRRAHLARQGIYLTLETGSASVTGAGRLNPLRRAAAALRGRMEQVLKATLPPREAGLMAGLLLGSRRDLPDEIKDAFKASGVFHLLAVSGAHLAMIILPILGLLRYLGLSRRAASGALIPLVLFFMLLTGGSPSVLRAGLMAMLVLLGEVLNRERDAVNTLGAACLLLLLWQPTLLFEVGFQLSVSATLGILLFARPLERWMTPFWQAVLGAKGRWVALGLAATFGAELLVEPISLFHFGRVSLVSPVTNLLLTLFMTPLLQVGMIAALLGLVALPVAWLLNQVVRLGVWLLLFTVNAAAGMPLAYPAVGRPPAVAVLLWYAGLAVVTSPGLRQGAHSQAARLRRLWAGSALPARAGAAALAVLLLATAWLWRAAPAGSGGLLEVVFLDVGQGDAILIRAPGGQAMLVDAGPATPPDPQAGRPGYDAGESVILPYLAGQRIRRLEYLLLTHPHQDHVGGAAAVLQALPVGALLDNGMAGKAQGYTAAIAAAAQKQIPVVRPQAGDQIRLGQAVVLEVLGPPPTPFRGTRSDENANSVILRLRYGQVAMLLTGDMEEVVEDYLLAQGAQLRADLLKVAHHGSAYSTSARLLEAVQPRHAVISLGRGNLFGHPNPGTVGRLQAAGAEVYRTDQAGSIIVQSDGLSLTVTGTRRVDESYRPVGIRGRRLIFAW